MKRKPRKDRKPATEAGRRKTARARAAARQKSTQARREAQMREVAQLRLGEHWCWIEIAAKMGCSERHCRNLLEDLRAEMRAESMDIAEQDRDYQLSVLDKVLARNMSFVNAPGVIRTVAKDRVIEVEPFEAMVKCSAVVIRALERRAHVLGSDRPARLEFGRDSEETLEAVKARLAAYNALK